MSQVYLDVPAIRIFPSQIMDHTRDLTETTLMKHPKNYMKIAMELFRTRDTANPGRILTKDTANQDTCQD